MMKGLHDDCPGCGNAYHFRLGSSQGLRCRVDGCHWGVVTTYVPAILEDPTSYTLSISSLPDNSLESVARLALRFNIPLPEARSLRASLPKPVYSGGAADVFALREELLAQKYGVTIGPHFKYDVFDDLPQGEFPLTAEDIAELRRDESIVGPESDVSQVD